MHALLAARAKLVDLRRDIENQMRGLLKSVGLPPVKLASKQCSRKSWPSCAKHHIFGRCSIR